MTGWAHRQRWGVGVQGDICRDFWREFLRKERNKDNRTLLEAQDQIQELCRKLWVVCISYLTTFPTLGFWNYLQSSFSFTRIIVGKKVSCIGLWFLLFWVNIINTNNTNNLDLHLYTLNLWKQFRKRYVLTF